MTGLEKEITISSVTKCFKNIYKPTKMISNMAKIKVDQNKCIGCGACAATCPKAFEMHEGKARVKTPEVKKITCESEAADICPVSAIIISK